jgi:hypothetical protein
MLLARPSGERGLHIVTGRLTGTLNLGNGKLSGAAFSAAPASMFSGYRHRDKPEDRPRGVRPVNQRQSIRTVNFCTLLPILGATARVSLHFRRRRHDWRQGTPRPVITQASQRVALEPDPIRLNRITFQLHGRFISGLATTAEGRPAIRSIRRADSSDRFPSLAETGAPLSFRLGVNSVLDPLTTRSL